MSGSSLDGLDIAYCTFSFDDGWSYNIEVGETIPYPEELILSLSESPNMNSEKLIELDVNYGKYLGQQVFQFIKKHGVKPDIIGSHGHTVFHNPEAGYTLQIGNGQAIVLESGIATVNDFRTGDILNGGQGAPLVPIGDKLLFSDYDSCINIGGIANISYKKDGKRIAYDVCPANQILNMLSKQLGEPYDENGMFAQLGKLDKVLFDKLNDHPYYKIPAPKSMSNQLVMNSFYPIVANSLSGVEDKLYTVCKHIAYQVNNSLSETKSMLITGGGAHNGFLTKAIQMETLTDISIPNSTLIDFKEALIFAFMAVLKMRGEVNCLATATGATKDSSSGVINNVGSE